MGPQAWKGEAIANLHQILFRPGASIFSSKPYAQERRPPPGKFIKLDSNIYSPVARKFLDEKQPPPTDYFKRPKLYQASKSFGGHGDNITTQPSKKKGSQLPKWSMGDLLPTSLVEPTRKGELPSEIVKTIWGPTPCRKSADDKKLEEETKEIINKMKKKKGEYEHKVVECLMDVLLRSWVYFEHSHESVKSIENHVHAKYCEGKFGHYLLADGTQVHGYYVISLRQLITELKSLLANLKGKVIDTTYKEVPIWVPPPPKERVEFCAPEEKPMPRLYPIEGLLPLPNDDIPLDSNLPLLQTPSLKPHPPYIKPKFMRKDAVLNIPPLDDFGEEERSIVPYKEIPLPIFRAPDLLPIPLWQEPQKEPLPSMPVSVEAKVLETPPQEIMPPYEMAKVNPRPCEASYYPIEPGQASICDGLCGRRKGSSQQGRSESPQYACLARSQPEIAFPQAPTNKIISTPTFQSPQEEPLPPFISPTLIQEPPYIGPPKPNFPDWVPPAPPPPIGYLAGHKPVFLVDCSATMAGDRLTCAQNVIRHLFSSGGQIEIDATHFDIIMYSFDAWSFGAFEEERKHKMNGGGPRHWVKSLELENLTSKYPGQFMQPKTHQNMEKAILWMSQWGSGGTSNLKKAIEVAMERTSADCIYLLTHGKCDRPVIIMSTLKELEYQGKLTPIYPVGLEPTKSQARIVKNVLADITGGQYMELDMKWQYKLYKEQTENFVSDEMKWLTARVEYWQRHNLEAGIPEKADTIITRLQKQFDMERKDPAIGKYRKEEEKAKSQHKYLLNAIREENRRSIEHAHHLYNITHALVLEKNKKTLEDARILWEAEVENVRIVNERNNQSYKEWQEKVLQIKIANKKSREDAQKRFKEDLKSIADRYRHSSLYGREEHDGLVKGIREKNDRLMRNHRIKQDEIIAKVKLNNAANWKDYEDKCAEVKTLNATNLEKAQRDFATECEKVIKDNERRTKEALEDHEWRFEVVTNENTKKNKEHMDKLEELCLKKLEARKSHQLRVSATVEKHKASIASIAAVNQNLEKEAKKAWEECCKAIDEENNKITNKCYEEWKQASRAVQMENEELARRRIDLQVRKEEVERMNNETIRKKKMDWKDSFCQLQEQYLEETERAKSQYEQYLKETELQNAQILKEAKVAYNCEIAAIKAYNESIQPAVEASRLVEKEIKRIQDFLGHIVSQSNIPGTKKSNEKRTLEQSLAMLGNLDNPCPPKVIIEALQIAYAGDLKRQSEMFFEANKKNRAGDANADESIQNGKKRRQGRFSGMKQIQPLRVVAHHCQDFNVDGVKVQHFVKPKKDMTVTFQGVQDVAKGNITSMAKEEKVERGAQHEVNIAKV